MIRARREGATGRWSPRSPNEMPRCRTRASTAGSGRPPWVAESVSFTYAYVLDDE